MATKKRAIGVKEFVEDILPENVKSMFGMVPYTELPKLVLNAYILGREHEKDNIHFQLSDGSILDYNPDHIRGLFGRF